MSEATEMDLAGIEAHIWNVTYGRISNGEFVTRTIRCIPSLIADLRRLTAERDAVLAAHKPVPDAPGSTVEWCASCDRMYPCETVQLLGGAGVRTT